MKRRLEEAATKNGRSLSQEAELRLEMSLSADRQLILAYGGHWLSVIRSQGGLLIALPIGWDEEAGIDDDLLPLKIAEDDLDRIRNFFTGAPPPYDMSRREYEAWAEEQEPLMTDEQLEASFKKRGPK